MIHRRWWWPVLVVATGVVAAEWLRRPAWTWVVLGGVLAAATGFSAWRGRDRWLAILCLISTALAATMGLAVHRLNSIATGWPAIREALVTDASQRLNSELRRALRRTDRAAAAAVELAAGDRAAAFRGLAGAVASSGPELGVALLEAPGTPWAWAGRFRVAPEPAGDSIAVRADGYYVVLEIRRHSAGGRVAVSSTLIWANPTAPRPERSLSARFAEQTGVSLKVFAPGTAPPGSDVFDYQEPTTEGPRLLFSVLPVPPDQADAKAQAETTGGGWVALLTLVALAIGFAGAGGAANRFIVLTTLLWVAIRSPAGAALGFNDLFSPATFYRSTLGPFASSAGVLGLTSLLALIGGFWLWRRRQQSSRPLVGVAAVLLIGAPYLITELGRGIAPPINGVPARLWITWQLVLALTTSAIIVLAAACLHGTRSDGPRGRIDWSPWVGVALAALAAVIGLHLWSPPDGWPKWYTLLWIPALVLVARARPRWSTVMAIALVAGAAASLVTWAAVLNVRIAVAQRDLNRLGEVDDPLAVPLLERLAEQVGKAGPLRTTADMYALWRASYLSEQDYPVRLTLWDVRGARQAELALDALDLPTPLLAALVQGLDAAATQSITRVSRSPGPHYILVERLSGGAILTAAIGPRSRLIPPTRLSRLLRPPAGGPPLYDLSLSPPLQPGSSEPISVGWHREGREIRTARPLSLLDTSRLAHASVSIRSLGSVLVRGALLVLLDATLLVALWALTSLRLDRSRPRLSVRRLARSFQARLAATLAVFFVVPAAGFAAWNFSRFDADAARGRDVQISQVLRDAVFTAGGLLRGPGDILTFGLQELSDRVDADLVLYSGGSLIATSAPILQDLGLVEPLLDPRVFQRLGLGDELALIRNGTTYMAPVRVGYRVVQSGPPGGIGILATPQPADDWFLADTQRDLAFVLLLATLGGIAAAIGAAQLVARALARPVAELRLSALSLGRGEKPPTTGTPPVEFEEVFGAFERMASDIRSSQAALESARRRTSAVLANVATGVLALDPRGAIIIANARVREMLGGQLEEGARLDQVLRSPSEPLADAVREFLNGRDASGAGELEMNGRRLRYQLARLGGDPGGAVLALDDITDVTQAARVLAWGEMARQVAHEIKNPLTPLRLGIQHLRRAYHDRRGDFDQTLDTTAGRILAEIDRLDTIARAFSRFGLPVGENAPLENVPLLATAHEVADLYHLGGESIRIAVEGDAAVERPACKDEVKEVLGNLLENARNAGAGNITLKLGADALSITDDGRGIPAELLPHLFEPRFSTTTSGSGLGLAIVKRLVESWGATIVVESGARKGTRVVIAWADPSLGPREPA